MSLYDLATTSDRPVITSSAVFAPVAPVESDDPGTPVVINIQSPEVKTALSKMAKFIPTESITIYLGAVSASSALRSNFVWLNPETVYWLTGLLLTPAIFLLIRAIECGKQRSPVFANFPYWKLLAAVVSFLVWALAIPGNPYATSDVAKISVAFMALVVSVLLDLIDQMVEARKAAQVAVQ